MKLFVGLGNPGPEYAGHRHNVGFMAVDRIAGDHGFGPWKKAHQGWVSEGRLAGDKVVLLKPDTYMNKSGQAVQSAVSFYKLPLSDLMVFHDELDLAPGKLRTKMAGGHAGHNGLRSVHAHLATAMAGSGSASATPATRMPWRLTCCTISPRLTATGWSRCCTASLTARTIWRAAKRPNF